MMGSRRAGRGVVIGLVLLFAVAACGGGEDETAPVVGEDETAPVVVRSADGVVTVTAASGASPDISITAVTELPELLAEAEAEGLQVFQYELGPDGQEFEEPVRIEFRLHHQALGLDVGVLPVAFLVAGDDEGFTGYEEVEIALDGDYVLIAGETTHFSRILVLVGGGWITMEPFGIDGVVGQQYQHRLTAEDLQVVPPVNLFGTGGGESLEYEWFAASPWLSVVGSKSGTISSDDTANFILQAIRCDEETPENSLAKYGVDLTLVIKTPRRGPIVERFGIVSVKRIRSRIDALAVCAVEAVTTTSSTSTIEVGSAAGSTQCPDPEAGTDQVGDGRAHPEFVRVLINEIGEAYLHMFLCAAYGQLPPDDLFSFFWLMAVSWNPTVEVGWQLHDGTVTVLGTMSEAYILDDGSLLVATGLTPTGDYTITIDANYGSWVAEDGAPAVFGNTQFSIPAADVVLGDPFEEAGAEPVYDLIAGE